MYLIYLDLLFSKARQIQNTKNLSLNELYLNNFN